MTHPSSARMAGQETLPSRLIHLFSGLSFICVAVSFSYLDRRYGFFFAESLFWIAWGTLGFTAGAYALRRAPTASKTLSTVLSLIAVVLAIFPAFFMYPMLRWISVFLMLVMAARAPMMRTRRDLYLCLTVCFAVSFMAATHFTANWTLWLYLGPAWIFAGLALTWDYTSSKAIGSWTKLGMSLGFIAVCTVVALLLFLFLPRPPLLGFGFIPPGSDAPSLHNHPADGTDGQGRKEGTSPGADAGNASGEAHPEKPYRDGSWRSQWQEMLAQMRPGSLDPSMPQWQKDFLGKLLGLAQALSSDSETQPSETDTTDQAEQMQYKNILYWLWALLLVLLTLALARLAYRHRYWLGVELMQLGARLVGPCCPLLAMRLSANALRCSLASAGHRVQPGQSLREYLAAAPALPQLSRRGFSYAVDVYCETRFGCAPATPLRAQHMRQAVSAATELVRGHSPELAKS